MFNGSGSVVGGAPTVTSGGIVPNDSSTTTIQACEWVSIFGSNLAAASVTWAGNFPTALGTTTSVTINGKLAYLWFVSPGQINLQAPNDTATGTVPVVVTTATGSATSTVTLSPFAPSFSLLDAKHVTGIILRSNGSRAYGGGTYDIIGPTGTSLANATVAAKVGDTLELFGVGFGPTNPVVHSEAGLYQLGANYECCQLLNNVSVTPSFARFTSARSLPNQPDRASGPWHRRSSVGGIYRRHFDLNGRRHFAAVSKRGGQELPVNREIDAEPSRIQNNNRVRASRLPSGIIAAVAGNGTGWLFGGRRAGPTEATLNSPAGLCTDAVRQPVHRRAWAIIASANSIPRETSRPSRAMASRAAAAMAGRPPQASMYACPFAVWSIPRAIFTSQIRASTTIRDDRSVPGNHFDLRRDRRQSRPSRSRILYSEQTADPPRLRPNLNNPTAVHGGFVQGNVYSFGSVCEISAFARWTGDRHHHHHRRHRESARCSGRRRAGHVGASRNYPGGLVRRPERRSLS